MKAKDKLNQIESLNKKLGDINEQINLTKSKETRVKLRNIKFALRKKLKSLLKNQDNS